MAKRAKKKSTKSVKKAAKPRVRRKRSPALARHRAVIADLQSQLADLQAQVDAAHASTAELPTESPAVASVAVAVELAERIAIPAEAPVVEALFDAATEPAVESVEETPSQPMHLVSVAMHTSAAVAVGGSAALTPSAQELPFEPQPPPLPDATTPSFIPVPGHENFAGGGYADRARTRPAGLFGFAAKLHDFGYTCNDLDFFRGPRYLKELSRFAKMDFIFMTLNLRVWNELRVDSRFSDSLASLVFRGHTQNFLPGDGFVNPIHKQELDDWRNYLMLPYSILPPEQRPTHPETHTFAPVMVGSRLVQPGRTVTVQAPDYNAPVSLDRDWFWRNWAEQKYSYPVWGALASIGDQTDSQFQLPG